MFLCETKNMHFYAMKGMTILGIYMATKTNAVFKLSMIVIVAEKMVLVLKRIVTNEGIQYFDIAYE